METHSATLVRPTDVAQLQEAVAWAEKVEVSALALGRWFRGSGIARA